MDARNPSIIETKSLELRSTAGSDHRNWSKDVEGSIGKQKQKVICMNQFAV